MMIEVMSTKRFRITELIRICIVLTLMVSNVVWAAPNESLGLTGDAVKASSTTRQYDEGWHFYHEEETEEKKPKAEEPEPKRDNIFLKMPSAREELEKLQQALEESKARAVLYPNRENLVDYMEKNEWMMGKSAKFADVWRRVVWSTPDLDYSLRSPNSNLALNVFHDERKLKSSDVIKALVEKGWGLFFFFRGDCPYCHKFAPILKTFSDHYHMDILPVTVDGGSLPEFPNPKFDKQVADEIGVTRYPSVYLVQPKIRKIVPIANGFVSLDELELRIFTQTSTQPGEEF